MNATAFSQQPQKANRSRLGVGVTLNKCDRLNATLRYLSQSLGKSPSISIPSKTPQCEASKSISLANMNFVRANQSAARAASKSYISGSDKLDTISQNKGS